jgi:Tfp pilus assembly protein PilN
MINLLPPDIKQDYHYARRNTHLLRWVLAMGVAFAGLAVLSAGGIWYINQAANDFTRQISVSEADLRRQNQSEVEKEIKDISGNLHLAVQVLSKEILFSKLLRQLAVVTPNNATLSSLTISKIQGAVDISANTTDYNAATQLQVNLADPTNKIFSKADIVAINCASASADSSTAQSKYPFTVTIRALFANNNPFLFINNNKPANQ